MADDEQFSLCWNNFNSNLSAGFHESLVRGDLVDVTLAAEGQFVKAHRLVLSVCSPYFRRMFTQMPANQHAFVFLKDVSHTALKDLIQFMYCGEVNVKQEALPAFISTAEALQIKGLTDSDPPPPQSPVKPSTPAPQPPPIQQMTSPRVRHRSSNSRSYKLESIDDLGDDNKPTTQIVIQTTTAPQQTIVQQTHQQQQQQQQHHQTQQVQQQQHTTSNIVTTTSAAPTHKRPAQRSIVSATTKRTKSTILDPLEAADNTSPSSQQISVQTVVADTKPMQQQLQQQQQQHQQQQHQQAQSEPEFIDLPIELPTKSEPDYAEESGEVETAEQETTYVEDDSYGDMRYDESYFTENEDGGNTTTVSANISGGAGATTSKALVKQQAFSDSSYAEASDPTNNEAQGSLEETKETARPVRRRGRPRQKPEDVVHPEKLVDKIAAAVAGNDGKPTVYASTTKGGMKLFYSGHHFKYSFRKGQYSIFQCCYKENNEQCKVRVVSNQKRVFPLDGEHVHFIQATDKSVTSVMIGAADSQDEQTEQPPQQQQHYISDDTVLVDLESTVETEAVLEQDESQQQAEVEQCLVKDDANISTESQLNANDFREKIKKRLQKALLGKKK